MFVGVERCFRHGEYDDLYKSASLAQCDDAGDVSRRADFVWLLYTGVSTCKQANCWDKTSNRDSNWALRSN
jgi:hypothetical protein